MTDLESLEEIDREIVAALAVRRAADRLTALPETLLAVVCDRPRDQIAARAHDLVAASIIERTEWEDGGETLPGYYIDDLRVRNWGREQARAAAIEEATVALASAGATADE